MTEHQSQREAARRKRDARIRWQYLQSMHYQRANRHGGWATGRGLVESIDWCGPDYKPDDDAHAMGLLQDLVTTEYAEEEDNREDSTQPFGLDHLTYKITAKGIAFMNRASPPDALIDDGRFIKK